MRHPLLPNHNFPELKEKLLFEHVCLILGDIGWSGGCVSSALGDVKPECLR